MLPDGTDAEASTEVNASSSAAAGAGAKASTDGAPSAEADVAKSAADADADVDAAGASESHVADAVADQSEPSAVKETAGQSQDNDRGNGVDVTTAQKPYVCTQAQSTVLYFEQCRIMF